MPQRDGVSLGDTLFAGAGAAYEDLPSEVKRRVDRLRAVNSYNAMYDRKASEFGVRPGLTDDEKKNKYPKDAVHPVLRTHPITGRKCIYVCEGYTTQILDVSEGESRELLDLLFAQVTKPQALWGGSPKSSISQRAATISSCALSGALTTIAAFWSQAVASQFAATVTGSAAPVTNPKKRPPVDAMVAGSTCGGV